MQRYRCFLFCERYVEKTGSLHVARACFASTVLHTTVYVLGGRGKCLSYVDGVEFFNVKQKVWTYVAKCCFQSSWSNWLLACVVGDTLRVLDTEFQKVYLFVVDQGPEKPFCMKFKVVAPEEEILIPFSKPLLSLHL